MTTTSRPPAPRPLTPLPSADRPAARRHRLTRTAFHVHLWLGVIFTVALVAISVTGILLNHKRGLGLMPEVDHEPTRPIAAALPLARLAAIGIAAADSANAGPGAPRAAVGDAPDVARIDRMDVRPRDGFVKVRLRDDASTEVTIDVADGRVLHVGRRGDVFLERLHSGEAFGDGWVLLSDVAALGLVATLITGYWLWLAPKVRREDGPVHAPEAR